MTKKEEVEITIQPKMAITGVLAIIFFLSIITNGFDPDYSKELRIIGIVDSTCTNCYDISLHGSILATNYGVPVTNIEVYDVNSQEGVNLLNKYNILYVPTIIVSEGLKDYGIVDVWSQLGTIEDGWYVFRSTASMNSFGVYKRLDTGQEILPTLAATEVPDKTYCGDGETVNLYALMSANCEFCEQEKVILDELKEEFGDNLNLSYVSAPLFFINSDGSINNSDIAATQELDWFDISWNASQKIIDDYKLIFINNEIIDEETGYTMVPGNPIFIFNCNNIRPTTLLSGEVYRGYPAGTEKTDMKNIICSMTLAHEACQ